MPGRRRTDEYRYGREPMEVYRYDLDVDLDALVRDARRAVDGWDWGRGAYGHALSLPASPPASSLRALPLRELSLPRDPRAAPRFQRGLRSSRVREVLLRLLRRGPGSAYTWHTDSHKGQGIVRFQIPLLTDGSDLPVDHRLPGGGRGSEAPVVPVDDESFERFSHANSGHFAGTSSRRDGCTTSTRAGSTRSSTPARASGSRSHSTWR